MLFDNVHAYVLWLYPCSSQLSVALTYSSKHRLHGLSERISHVIQAMEEEGELAADPESDSVADASFNPRTTSSSLSCAQRQPQGRLEPLGAPQTVLLSRGQSLWSHGYLCVRTCRLQGFF